MECPVCKQPIAEDAAYCLCCNTTFKAARVDASTKSDTTRKAVTAEPAEEKEWSLFGLTVESTMDWTPRVRKMALAACALFLILIIALIIYVTRPAYHPRNAPRGENVELLSPE